MTQDEVENVVKVMKQMVSINAELRKHQLDALEQNGFTRAEAIKIICSTNPVANSSSITNED